MSPPPQQRPYCSKCSPGMPKPTDDNVLDDNSVVLNPCNCRFCVHCFLQILAETRLEPSLQCPSCHHVVMSHRGQRPSWRTGDTDETYVPEEYEYNYLMKTETTRTPTQSHENGDSADNGTELTAAASIHNSSSNHNETKDSKSINSPKKRRKYKTFETRLEELKAYKEQHGTCRVHSRVQDYQSLFEWVKCIRSGRLKVTAEQRQALDQIGFVWETRVEKLDREWEAKFERLKSYKQKYGHCAVPWEWSCDKRLSEWVCTQRKLNAKNKLRQDRKRKLEEIDFVFVASAKKGGGEVGGVVQQEEQQQQPQQEQEEEQHQQMSFSDFEN